MKIILFSKDAINCSKVTVKTFIMLQIFLFQINAVLFELSTHLRIRKNASRFPQKY